MFLIPKFVHFVFIYDKRYMNQSHNLPYTIAYMWRGMVIF